MRFDSGRATNFTHALVYGQIGLDPGICCSTGASQVGDVIY